MLLGVFLFLRISDENASAVGATVFLAGTIAAGAALVQATRRNEGKGLGLLLFASGLLVVLVCGVVFVWWLTHVTESFAPAPLPDGDLLHHL
jgi:O-antigen ligase